jgi:4-hydroxy-3-methylbut-2-en-1-yl diphosphate synthase IspG/GcpE
MDNAEDNPVEEMAVSDVLKNITGDKHTLTLYGYCPGCGEIHTNLASLVEYLQFLTDMSMINFN